uniref:URB1 ribosome biogenesis homolog n=1 Tax=Kryptolebias marmoratus TaxID=37003 RepID=A0A3Q2ZZQ8_KRYMA
MGKKRHSDVPSESDPPQKKEKVPEFNGTEFKAMLRNPATAMKGLEKFTSTAKKLPCSDLYDVVEGYIKISMECADIFNLLEGEKHTETEMMLVFGSLEVILLRTASDLSHFNMVGNAIVKKIASSYMKLLQGSFYSSNHGFVRQCLNLLSAMVSQGVEAAREVLDHIQIKTLSGLATRKDKRGKPDVRLAFIQFVLSFLVSGDSAVIRQTLELKELLPHILNTGLKEDRMSTVNLILSTLKSKVVLNKAISKTQKVRFFTPAVLANLASLYKWNGIADATTEDSDSSGLSVVRELVHSFLLDLCCSHKHGISFHDASLGTAGRAGNLVLLQFLVGLKQATEDELVADLVVNVLKTSPDILSRYFKETQYSYTPRLKSAWQDNVNLLKKIYEAQPDISTVFQNREMIPLPRLLSMIMVISVPPVCNKAFFTQGLNLASSTVQLMAVSIMNFILKKASKNMEYLLDKSVWYKSDVYTDDMMEELVQQYRETLGKILPDMTGIISSWQSLSKKEKAGVEDKETKREERPEQTNNENELPAEVILLKALILQVICLYQKVVPHLVMQCKFDFSKLLKGIVSEKGMREEIPPILQYQILQLALDLPASKFSWCRIQDIAYSESSSGEKSVLYLLLKMFVSSNNSSHLRPSTQKLVLKVLKDTGVFEYTLPELELWLEQLARLEPNQQETVIQFLERVLVKLVCSSHEYTDKVASFVQEAGHLQANLSSQEGDAVSIAVSHIDDVLDMLDVIMEGSDGEMEEFGPSLSEELIIQTFPFSTVVPAALEARNKLPADKGVVCEYLCAVLSDVLHCQRDPLPLCLTLLQYDKELVFSQLPASFYQSIVHLHQYSSRWLPQQCRQQLFKSSECLTKEVSAPASCSLLLKAAYVQGPAALLEDTFRQNIEKAVASMPLAEFPVVIKQVLLYIRSTVEDFGMVGAKIKLIDQSYFCLIFILVSALTSIFKHPCLEQWFLALELAAFPPHSLKPVALKHLCAQMTDNILTLLKISAPALNDLSHLELLCSYMVALERATLKELQEKGSRPPKTHSRTFQALLSLHSYMDSSNLRELVSQLLLLPHDSLICPSSEGTQSELSIYGQVALHILTKCTSTSYQDHSRFLTQAHLHGLGTLFVSCSSPELEAFMLQTLSYDPGSAKLIHTDVLLHCLQKPLRDSLAISSLLLENCSSHRLRFEVWCLEPSNMDKMSETDAFFPLINTYLQVASREDPARPKDGVNRYSDHHFLNTLSNVLELMYGSSEVQKDLIPLSTLYMMTSSHSRFLPTMLDSSEEPTRKALVSLLLCLVKKCPTVCNSNHFVVLLAAYGATLSTSDQKLLLLLQEYEKNHISLLQFQSFLWGPAAVEHHKTRKSLGASLWKQPSSDDVLALLKTDAMIQTILKFPQQRRILPQVHILMKDLGSLYDPCFLLPLFSAILRPECVIDCLKFASCHALGVTVMALSSYDPKVRAAAYHVLSCFYQHLEAARFREKRQLLYLMNIVKNGIRKQNQRLPFILTSYINKVAQQMLRPEDHMYVVLNRFLLAHHSLDLRRVPEFFKLFNGFELEHKIEREWILNVLEEGISDGHCYELCNQQGIFEVLLSFSSSPLCSEHFQTQILRVLCRAARVTKAAYSLTKSCGLLSWMIQAVEKRNLNQQLLCAMIDLLHVLWFTILGQKEKKVHEASTSSSTEEISQSLMKCLPLLLVNEFLCVSLAICRHLRLGVKAAQFSLFVQTLCSVLTHRGTALSVNKQADRLMLHPQPLSCTETLSLLLCWASLSHHTPLLTQIQALSERNKLNHVSQDKFQEVNPPEDIKTQEEKLLTDCKVHLSRIFVHWEPVFHLSEPQPDQPRDKLDPSQLAGDTALLLTKWSLRWLVENPSDEYTTREFLHWFEKVTVKHRNIVNLAMLNFGLKADLLQLFHLTFEARRHSSFSTGAETLQLFTNIMICLLEMQGHLPDVHQAVIAACLTHQDQSRRAGLSLLSLYVHELWSGAASAELFLSHVRLVTRDKNKKQKASKPSKPQTAIRAICNHIIVIKR